MFDNENSFEREENRNALKTKISMQKAQMTLCYGKHTKCTSKKLIKKLRVLNSSLNHKQEREQQMGDHIANMEIKSSRLTEMNEPVYESMQVALLVSSLSNL